MRNGEVTDTRILEAEGLAAVFLAKPWLWLIPSSRSPRSIWSNWHHNILSYTRIMCQPDSKCRRINLETGSSQKINFICWRIPPPHPTKWMILGVGFGGEMFNSCLTDRWNRQGYSKKLCVKQGKLTDQVLWLANFKRSLQLVLVAETHNCGIVFWTWQLPLNLSLHDQPPSIHNWHHMMSLLL